MIGQPRSAAGYRRHMAGYAQATRASGLVARMRACALHALPVTGQAGAVCFRRVGKPVAACRCVAVRTGEFPGCGAVTHFPAGVDMTVAKAGHFLQEDKGEELAQVIIEFIERGE